MKAGLYCRVSTRDQTVENQRSRLEDFCASRDWETEVFVDDGISGTRSDRPGYNDLLDAARAGEIDVVVVEKLDRLGRSMSQLVMDVERLQEWGVDLVVRDGSVDTTSRYGKLQLAVFSALSEIERDIISERTKAAYERKQANGEDDWGRPQKNVSDYLLNAVEAGDLTQTEAAERADVSRATIQRRLKERAEA